MLLLVCAVNLVLSFSKVNQPIGNATQGCVLRQPIYGWPGAWENLGTCLECFSPLVWDFVPERVWNPVEVANHMKKGCLAHTKEMQILALCCDIAYTYRACVLHPQRGKRVSASEDIQMNTMVKPETQVLTTTVSPVVKKKQWKQRLTWLVRQE